MDKRTVLPPLCLAALMAVLFAVALSFRADRRPPPGVESLSQWQMEGEAVSLPLTVGSLPARTPLVLTATLHPKEGDYLYVKTVYAPLRLYVDGALLFEYGQPGSYPDFLIDPPTKTALVPLPDAEGTVTLRMEYASPAQRSSITLHPVLVGSSAAVLMELIGQMPWGCSCSWWPWW